MMRRERADLMLVSGILLIFACSGIQNANHASKSDGELITPRNLNAIIGIEWNLTHLKKDNAAMTLVENSKTTFTVDQEYKVSGKATINRYSGNIKLQESGKIIWNKAFIMTRMAGPPELMQQEANFTQALMQTTRMYLKESKLILKNQDGSTILRFEPIT